MHVLREIYILSLGFLICYFILWTLEVKYKLSTACETRRPLEIVNILNDTTAPSGAGLPHYRDFTITLRHTKLCRTPLDEWSAQRRSLYPTTHNNRNRQHAFFYINASVFLNSILIRSKKMKQYAGIYLLQNHSTCFRRPSHPSWGIHKSVTASSGTGHSIWATTFLQRDQIRTNLGTLEEGCCSYVMTCTRGCSFTFMYSWWWVRWTPKTCTEWFCSK